jgi:hypothetical protein
MTKIKWPLIFFIISIFFITYKVVEYNNSISSKENFTSGFRIMYRPHIRNIRLVGSKYYNQFKNNMHLIFRKFGLI